MSALAQLKHSQLLSLDQGGELWELYRQAAAESLYFFTKGIWSMRPAERNLMSRRAHLPVCLLCQDESIRRLLVEDPRKHMKSTIATQARPVHRLIRRSVEGKDPCDRFAIYSASIINSRRHWREISNVFIANEWFRFLFPDLVPDIDAVDKKTGKKRWNESEGVVPRMYDPKEPTFDCLGMGKATSRHYDDICIDDFIDEENFDSETAVQKAVEYWRLANNLLEDDNSTLVVVGNRWTMVDLNHTIHMESPDTVVLSRSCYGPNLEGKYKSRNLPDSVMELLKQHPEGEPLWPERFDKEALGRLLTDLKPRIFTAQYLNNPADPEATDFRLEWVKYGELEQDKEQGIVFTIEGEDGEEKVPLSSCNLYITWDPAVDGKHAESENAIVVSAMDWRGRVFVLDEYAKKNDPLVALDDLLRYAHRWRRWLKATGVEEVMFAKVLGTLLVQRANKSEIFLGIKKLKVPTGMSKDQRIRAWVGTFFESGRVYVRRKCSRFIEQYAMFGVEGAKRDLIDAFAYGTQLWSRALSPDETEREELESAEQDFNRGVTGYGSALKRTA